MTHSLTVQERRSGAGLTIHLSGELDARSAQGLTSRVEHMGLDDGLDTITVDLAGLRFLDSSGLSALIQLRRLADDRSLGFTVASVRPTQRQLLDIVGLLELLGVEDDR